MFPVRLCFGIELKRFVEEETQRKRLGSVPDELVESNPSTAVWLLRGIPRLRFASLGITG
jgi:hypothetical protein